LVTNQHGSKFGDDRPSNFGDYTLKKKKKELMTAPKQKSLHSSE